MVQSPTSGVISEAWDLYLKHFGHLVTLALIVQVIVLIVNLVFVALFGVAGVAISVAVVFIGTFWLQGALIVAAEDIRDGRADLSVGDTFGRVSPKLGAIIGAGVLAGIGIAIGLALLIIPGLILLTFWLLVIPAIVLENRRVFESFGRSSNLVSGYAMSVFGVIVLTFLIMVGFSIVLNLLLVLFETPVRNAISNLISGTLTSPFVVMIWTLLYYRLRDAKAGATQPPTA